MSALAFLILLILLSDTVLHIIADLLNLKHTSDEIPPLFQHVYDRERYTRAQSYLRTKTRFGWWPSTITLAATLLFWFYEGFAFLDRWVHSLGQGPVVTGLLFIGILGLLSGLLSLPFSIYNTFRIEDRFGFNKTTWQTFLMDRIKGLGLGLILGTPLLGGILAFFLYAGEMAWWLCWIAVSGYMLVVQFIAPRWLMPLFNKFRPLEAGPLKDAVFAYATAIDFPLKEIHVMDGSRRSEKSNAFFTGFGSNRRIVLFDTLVIRHRISELVAVLAHEVGHYRYHHIHQGIILGILQAGLMFFLLSLMLDHQGLYEAFYMDRPSVHAGLIFFGLLYAPVEFFMGIGLHALSRRNEYAADRFAVQSTGDPQALSDALKKLAAHNLSNLYPHPFYVFLNYSHPPLPDRIRAIEGGAMG